MKKILCLLCVLLTGSGICSDMLIITVNGKDIRESDIQPDKATEERIFKKKHERLPEESDTKQVEEIRSAFAKLKLASLVHKYFNNYLLEKYYHEAVSEKMEKEWMKNMQETAWKEKKRKTALVNAIEFVKKSDDPDKYQKAYKEFLEKDTICSYEFFKANCEKEYYLKFLKDQLNKDYKTLSPRDKELLFSMNTKAFFEKKASEKEKAPRPRFSNEQERNLYMHALAKSWMFDQMKEMGYELHSDKYGNLEEIMFPPTEKLGAVLFTEN